MRAATVHSVRAIVCWTLRILGVLTVAFGAYLFLKRLAFGIGSGSFEGAFQAWTGVGEDHSAYRGIAMVVVGTALAVVSRWVARWAIVTPGGGCPRCGYDMKPDEPCPECGWRDGEG